MLLGKFNGPHQFLTEDGAHAGTEELEVTDSHRDGLPFDAAPAYDERFRLPALGACLLQLLLVAPAAVRKLQRIFRQDVGMPLREGAGIEELPDPLPSPQPEVIRALGADPIGTLQLTAVDEFAAIGAFDPEVFRNVVLGAVVVRLFLRTKLSPALEEIPHRRHGAPCHSTFAGTVTG